MKLIPAASLFAAAALFAAPAAAAPGPAAAPDLSAYAGKYPFDVVNGHRFLDHPAVQAAIAAAVPDAKLRAGIDFAENSLGLPIARVDGGRLLIWGGAWRAEDRYNWAVVIASDGSDAQVCIYDGVGYGEDFQASQWFEAGRPSVMKQGSCPSSAEEYPPEDVAAG
ncbi:hypothetical protein [Sphingopyxis sp.]|jgi:hypothetical protein|uniref:hypothetical protein n=1 Tax=Sphingopyxis sp. TaxID=1908224 RepID=UPI003F6ECC56